MDDVFVRLSVCGGDQTLRPLGMPPRNHRSRASSQRKAASSQRKRANNKLTLSSQHHAAADSDKENASSTSGRTRGQHRRRRLFTPRQDECHLLLNTTTTADIKQPEDDPSVQVLEEIGGDRTRCNRRCSSNNQHTEHPQCCVINSAGTPDVQQLLGEAQCSSVASNVPADVFLPAPPLTVGVEASVCEGGAGISPAACLMPVPTAAVSDSSSGETASPVLCSRSVRKRVVAGRHAAPVSSSNSRLCINSDPTDTGLDPSATCQAATTQRSDSIIAGYGPSFGDVLSVCDDLARCNLSSHSSLCKSAGRHSDGLQWRTVVSTPSNSSFHSAGDSDSSAASLPYFTPAVVRLRGKYRQRADKLTVSDSDSDVQQTQHCQGLCGASVGVTNTELVDLVSPEQTGSLLSEGEMSRDAVGSEKVSHVRHSACGAVIREQDGSRVDVFSHNPPAQVHRTLNFSSSSDDHVSPAKMVEENHVIKSSVVGNDHVTTWVGHEQDGNGTECCDDVTNKNDDSDVMPATNRKHRRRLVIESSEEDGDGADEVDLSSSDDGHDDEEDCSFVMNPGAECSPPATLPSRASGGHGGTVTTCADTQAMSDTWLNVDTSGSPQMSSTRLSERPHHCTADPAATSPDTPQLAGSTSASNRSQQETDIEQDELEVFKSRFVTPRLQRTKTKSATTTRSQLAEDDEDDFINDASSDESSSDDSHGVSMYHRLRDAHSTVVARRSDTFIRGGDSSLEAAQFDSPSADVDNNYIPSPSPPRRIISEKKRPAGTRHKLANTVTHLSFTSSLSTHITVSCVRHPDAQPYINNFKRNKHQLVGKLFLLFNQNVFDMRLPADMQISFNNRLLKTAGYCYNSMTAGCHDNQLASRDDKHNIAGASSRIELSTKVVDSAERLRDTLVHELCHAASWLVSGCRAGHGPVWRGWMQRARHCFPELPVTTRCHNYRISYRFTYRCTSCGYCLGRHSRSLDTQRKVCGRCRGRFQCIPTAQLARADSEGRVDTAATPRQLNPFASYVKQHYGTLKRQQTHLSHAQVMKQLGQQFAQTKITQ